METKFCPSCKSMISKGVCSNRNCQKTELEIYNDEVNRFIRENTNKKYYKRILNEFNDVYCLDSNFDCTSLEGSEENINSFHDVADLEKMGVTPNIKCITDDKEGYQFLSLSSATHKEVRGKVLKEYPYYVKLKVLYVEKNLNDCIEFYFGSFNKRDWFFTSNIWESISVNDLTMQVHWLIGFKYYISKRWSIIIKKDGNDINFKYPIDKKTANRILRLRNKKEDTNRRVTLLHLVNSYTRNNYQKNVDVKSHLRGNYKFKICDLDCELNASLKDVQVIQRE